MITTPPHILTPRQQAAAWFARRRATDFSNEEKQALQEWRESSVDNERAWAALELQWRSARQLGNDDEIARLRTQVLQDTAVAKTSSRRPLLLAAAALVMAIGVGLVVTNREPAPVVSTFVTQVGEQKTVTLDDGSELRLDTATAIDVRFTEGQRRITLNSGRARFSVAHDASRPFVVQAAGGSITALGTVFDVSKQADRVTVYLSEGKVRVGVDAAARPDSNASTVLSPGERVAYRHNDFLHAKEKVSADVAAGWMQRNLILQETTLHEAVGELNRYSTAQIRIADESLRMSPLNGVFHIDDREGFLHAIETALPVEVVHEPNGDVLLQQRRR